MRNTFIIVKFELEGVHRYPKAPPAVSYLRSPHRHMFHIEIGIQVFHEDRELEFIQVKNYLQDRCRNYFGVHVAGRSTKSCEQIAEAIRKIVLRDYPHEPRRLVHVQVMEDGESGVYIADEEVYYVP